MTTPSQWSDVDVDVQSSLATALTVSAISKANPGVVSYTGTDPSNGDYVLVSALGMTEVDGRVFRVANVNTSADTFQLEGEDTTLYGTFLSGTARVITFGTSVTTITGLNAAGGDFDFIDTTTIHSTVRTQIPGLASPGVYTCESFWDPSSASLLALKQASQNKAQRCVRFSFADGRKFLFNGYVGATLFPTGNAQDLVKSSLVFTMFGSPTVYGT
jgi:hypothetical protein